MGSEKREYIACLTKSTRNPNASNSGFETQLKSTIEDGDSLDQSLVAAETSLKIAKPLEVGVKTLGEAKEFGDKFYTLAKRANKLKTALDQWMAIDVVVCLLCAGQRQNN